MSNTARILGWFRAAVARASCSKRRRRSASAESACGKTLIATSRLRRESPGRENSAIPPAPRREAISYGPSFVPEARFMRGQDYHLAANRAGGCACQQKAKEWAG